MVELMLVLGAPTLWFVTKNPRWMILWVTAGAYFFLSGIAAVLGG